jgi:inosine-uridine nucleoside N-ribohydrolase
MTARARQVFDALPPRVLKQIKKLAQRMGKTPEQIIEAAVDLFSSTHKKGSALSDTDPLNDPVARATFSRIMSATIKRTNAKMTAAEKTARGEAGAAGRAKKLSPEERKRIASDAAKKRWANKQPKAD